MLFSKLEWWNKYKEEGIYYDTTKTCAKFLSKKVTYETYQFLPENKEEID
jgi:hypothetical protein